MAPRAKFVHAPGIVAQRGKQIKDDHFVKLGPTEKEGLEGN
jgi:hypothetical protein